MNKTLQQIKEEALAKKCASSISIFAANPKRKDLYLPEHDHALYDLASLTKIIGTTLAIIRAIAKQKLTLDDRPFAHWPYTTVRQLLSHTSGLLAHKNFYEQLPLNFDFKHNKKLIFEDIFALSIKESPKIYSDLGFISLGFLLERIYQKDLWQIFMDTWQHFGIEHNFFYCPSKKLSYTCSNKNIAPTGSDGIRDRIRGQVNDTNCYFMGGIAGHAGIFGDIVSVAHVGKFIYQSVIAPVTNEQRLIKYFSQHALGFFLRDQNGSTKSLSPQAFGHFGYTGVSLWVDPLKHLLIAILTNRVNEGKEIRGIFELRSLIHTAVTNLNQSFV